MATIKAYTDVSQSKTLSKILPLESADMCYLHENGQAKTMSPSKLSEILNVSKPQVIPCWSLASLLDVLIYPHIEQNYMGQWICRVEQQDTTYLWGDSNPVDACVVMIERLHELTLL